jgi:hypothetical protein
MKIILEGEKVVFSTQEYLLIIIFTHNNTYSQYKRPDRTPIKMSKLF